MKPLLLALFLTMGLGSVQASPYTPLPAFVPGFLALSLFTMGDVNDPRMFKTLSVSHANNPNGYAFDITQFEYDNNKTAFVVN